MIGRILEDRYEIQEEVGRGGMGVVYRGLDRASGVTVAIKILPHEISADPLQAGRFSREVLALQRLSHPNVVGYHGSGQVDGLPFLAMEFVTGRTLAEAIAHAADPLREALRLAMQIGHALGHAHELGIVHRDLKPGNVMVTEGGNVKVMDFGLARRLHDETRNLTMTGGLVGTFAYLPPEQALGRRVDHRADMYALGVLLYELCAGVLPFTAPDPVSIIFHHISTVADPPSAHNPAIWADLDAFILRLLAKDPADRYERMAAVVEEVERLLAEPSGEAAAVARVVRPLPFGGSDREAARQRLAAALEEAVAGYGSAWLILGPAEIGKTRLVQELRSHAHLQRARFVEAPAPAGRPPGGLLATVLPALLDDLAAGERRALLEAHHAVIAALAPTLAAGDHTAEAPGEVSPATLARDAVKLLSVLADKFPCVLFVDDAHRLDAISLAILAHLAEAAEHLAVLLIVAADEEALVLGRAPHDALGPLARGDRCIVLHPLEPEAAATLLTAAWPQGDTGARERIVVDARGFPSDLHLRVTAAALGSRPLTIRDAIEAVLDAAARDGVDLTVLGAAAEAEGAVSAELMQALTGCAAATAEETLRAASLAGLLRPGWYLGHGCHVFTSGRVRAALRARQSATHRFTWRARLVSLRSGQRAWPGEVAIHLEAAGDLLGAAHEWHAAARTCATLGDLDEARGALDRATALLEGSGLGESPEAVSIRCALGDLMVRGDALGDAVEAYREAAARAGRLTQGSGAHLTRALASLSDALCRSGRAEEAMRLLAAQLHAATSRGAVGAPLQGEGHARLLFALAAACRLAGRLPEAVEHLDRARGEIRHLLEGGHESAGLRRLEAECQQTLADVYEDRGDWERALAARLEALQAWKDLDSAAHVIGSYEALARLSVQVKGDDARAARYYEKALEVSPCPPRARGRLLRGLATCCRRQGQWDRVRPLLESSLADARTDGTDEEVVERLRDVGDVACQQGDAAAAGLFEEAAAMAHARGDGGGAAEARAGLARCHLAQGAPLRARDALQPSLDLPTVPRRVLYAAAEAALRLGESDTAHALAERMGPAEDGIALRLAGLLAFAADDRAAAAERLEHAVAALAGEGLEWESATALLDLAVVELEREGLPVLPGLVPDAERPFRLEGDGARDGISRLEQAARQFGAIGALRERQRAQHLLRAAVQAAAPRVIR